MYWEGWGQFLWCCDNIHVNISGRPYGLFPGYWHVLLLFVSAQVISFFPHGDFFFWGGGGGENHLEGPVQITDDKILPFWSWKIVNKADSQHSKRKDRNIHKINGMPLPDHHAWATATQNRPSLCRSTKLSLTCLVNRICSQNVQVVMYCSIKQTIVWQFDCMAEKGSDTVLLCKLNFVKSCLQLFCLAGRLVFVLRNLAKIPLFSKFYS